MPEEEDEGVGDGAYVLAEDKILEVLQGDERLSESVATFEAEGTKAIEDYNSNELPAIVVQVEGSSAATADIAQGVIEEIYDVSVFVIDDAGNRKRRRRSIKNIVAYVEYFLPLQCDQNQLLNLWEDIPNAEAESLLVIKTRSETVSAPDAEKNRYRAVAKIDFALYVNKTL